MVGIAALIAVIASGNESTATTEGLAQVRPVETSGASLPPLPESGADPAIGQPAPSISGIGFDGTPVPIKPATPTLYVLLAHWCPHCQREVPRLVEWMRKGDVPAGLQVIGVATSTTSERPNYPPSVWLEREQFPWPVIADSINGDAANAMGLTGFPYFVLVGADGTVLLRQTGEIDPAVLTTEITTALGT